MKLKCSKHISLCDSEDKQEVMEEDKEAAVLDVNFIKIADTVKPEVDADVNDVLWWKMVNELEDCESEVLKYLPSPARVTFVSFVVIDAAQHKRGKYTDKCAAIGYGFLTFSFSSLGELEAYAVTLLKHIQKFYITQDIRARVAIHIFNRISFAIAKGVGAQIKDDECMISEETVESKLNNAGEVVDEVIQLMTVADHENVSLSIVVHMFSDLVKEQDGKRKGVNSEKYVKLFCFNGDHVGIEYDAESSDISKETILDKYSKHLTDAEKSYKIVVDGKEYSYVCDIKKSDLFPEGFDDNFSVVVYVNVIMVSDDALGYGTVVDVFIPDRKSKAGKRFAFVRFIKVDNVDRLVGNLCTLWIGRMHLHANVARFDRPPIHSSRPNISTRPAANGASSFASVLKGNPNNFNHIASSPAMVLDDECVVERDLDNFVMGETKMRFLKHVGVASWFSQLCKAQPDFVSRERIVWIDIEGVPLHAWSRPTFSKIGSRWGEVIELEDNKEDCFARKRICIKTKLEDNILEKFKIIVRGKNFVIRAKELFVWSPTFNDNKEVDDYSEDDSVNGAEEINGDISKQMNLDDETDIEGVSDTVFDDKADSLGHEHTQNLSPNEKENSSDPFNLYNLLNKRDKGEANSGLDSSIPFPPGFTPEREFQHVDAQEVQGMENSLSKRRSEGLSSRVLEDAQPLNEHASPSIDSKKKQVARYWRL
ncbi:RNA-directed DNA polymerase, eukaryota [Tanacetum coccineum]